MSDDPRVGARPRWRVSRELRPEGTVVDLGRGVLLGGPEVVVMAGPCAVEGRTQMLEIAEAARAAGAAVLRGGAFKPRTSPYSFQGLGVRGLELLAEAREATGMPVVTEAVDTESVPLVAEYADMVQVGARNMQNFGLLRRVGGTGKPVLLKRGVGATVDELLLAAEYILAEGNEAVALCERGVRGFDPAAPRVFDLNAIPLLRALTHLPLVADPSHGTGVRAHVAPMARAAVAAGADGIIVELHTNPSEARSDGDQSIYPGQLRELVPECEAVARAVGRSLASPTAAPAAVADP